jgi:hypothetical protein
MVMCLTCSGWRHVAVGLRKVHDVWMCRDEHAGRVGVVPIGSRLGADFTVGRRAKCFEGILEGV